MNILCAIGLRDGPEVVRRVLGTTGADHDLYLLHVIDTGPRRVLEEFLHGPGMLHRPPVASPGHERPIDEAELAAGNAALEETRQEAAQAGFRFQTELLHGKPEQLIIKMAQDWTCQLIAIQASQGTQGWPQIGPESVGHIARFVLDHAACDVLLLRQVDKSK